MKGLRVIQAGPLALIQDSGRFGVNHLGVTQGGAADWISHRWANWLLGNPVHSAALEIVIGGNLTLEAEREVTLALVGADLGARIDDAPLAAQGTFTLAPGQRLCFRRPQGGLRTYLAFPGGLDAPETLGSRACTVREKIGGLTDDGAPLKTGDRLTWHGGEPTPRWLPRSAQLPLPAQGVVTLPFVLGAQAAHFAGRSLYQAFNQEWTVDQRADRMGIRLTGTPLKSTLTGIVSEGIPLGAVQIPPDGQPIVLMNDRQTIGGYPRIGALTPGACARLAQCLPGTRVRLAPISATQAQMNHRRQLSAWG
ncbi:biotin-dependent carboxyltransferase family protein [Vreelandella malpeensis]|uniref:Biotin-dependent carboxyltransferase family protein n=1 Tax=Vreelandella malpeensis TaxID=1172368 RepID=A0ABS8DT08_9GAMM|nr:biotin-dependent carboxyltransferase family protein [Halomonas malpeensis]MCB8889170.1 biotin-dependent carboxyltransferase family protein [Halomonas malpeensis]